MEQSYQVTVGDVTNEYPRGTTFGDIAKEHQSEYEHQIALVIRNGKIRELFKKVDQDCEVTFITLADAIGNKTYDRTATLILMKAINDVVGKEKIEKIKVEFSIGNGIYCSGKGDFTFTQDLVDKIKNRMLEIIADNILIIKKSLPIEEANMLFEKNNMKDKINLFRYRGSSTVNVYNLDGYYDYYYGYMLPSTGYIKYFDLLTYNDGIVLVLPNESAPEKLDKFEAQPSLFTSMMTTSDWGIKMGIDTVGDLNDQIRKGNFTNLMLVQEALQERRIGEIASDIVNRKGVKFVMIAGPSSSGKTTFSHRLSVQLRTYGLTPHPIGLDDYFKNRIDTPKLPNGDYDFENLAAIDVELFNKNMQSLLAGETVEMPRFNFVTGEREYHGDYLTMGPDDILVIEGIHGLNDKLSYTLPTKSKYKIYISCLTTINIDEHNRIPTNDGRLLRRMVRDARTRGASAKRTIHMWPDVRAGEAKNIFPFQENADAMFNSASIFEIAALKSYAEPLLYTVEPGDPEYFEAVRLLRFLNYFLSVGTEDLPKNSIVREFVGGSCFRV